MHKGPSTSSQENSVPEDLAESDKYTLDNLDLLNLRVSFSSDVNASRRNIINKNSELESTEDNLNNNNRTRRSRRRSDVNILSCAGDFQNLNNRYKKSHSADRKEKEDRRQRRHRQNWSEEAALINPRPPRPPTTPSTLYSGNGASVLKEESCGNRKKSGVGAGGAAAKSVIVLYSNRKFGGGGGGGDSLRGGISDEFLVPRHRRTSHSRFDVLSTDLRKSLGEREGGGRQDSPGRFPFSVTPSGNYKINSNQVVFESKKLSVLVADPSRTKVNINGNITGRTTRATRNLELITNNNNNNNNNMQREGEGLRNSLFDQIVPSSSMDQNFVKKLTEHPPQRRDKEASEYEGKAINEILDPELNLNRLGYTASDVIDWNEVILPEKKNLYLELYSRITNFTNADCKVYIDNEEFNCHLLVLQCYSEVFHTYVAVKKVELPADKCSPASFGFIYEWMITGDPSYRNLNRENVLEIFNAAKYLKIRDLVEQCWAFIDNPDVFNEDTAFLLYIDARDKNLPEVRELMLPRIQKFFLMLVSSQDWLELELDDVQNLLQSNYICINCEMEVFMSAMRWLKHDYENRSKFKVPLLKCVRFGNIAPWQLVDIKRNLDNQDFKEAAMDPEICKMIDDGLAFVIIKYWYGQENEDYQHWNSILSLKEPPTRNWSGMDKTYFTYREFLIYLDQYRRVQMIEKSKPKEKKKKLLDHNMHADTLDTFERRSLTKMNNNGQQQGGQAEQSMLGKKANNQSKSPRKMLDQRMAMKNSKAFNHSLQQATHEDCAYTNNNNSRRMQNVEDRYFEARVKSPFRNNHNNGGNNVIKKKKKKLLSRKEAAIVIQRAFRKHLMMRGANKHAINKRNTALGRGERGGGRERKGEGSSSSLSTKQQRWANMDQQIYSAVIAQHSPFRTVDERSKKLRDLTVESSLFIYDRESVLVFGGIDPHSNYGVGRNTGKDVYRYVPDRNEWEFVSEMPEPRHHHQVVFVKGRAYLVGGADPRSEDKRGKSTVVGTVWSFCPAKRYWYTQENLLNRRKNFGLVASDKYIFAIGGQDSNGRTLQSVERYNTSTGKWVQCAPLTFPKMGIACAKFQEKIWTAGGMSGSKRHPLSNNVECYDIERDQWTEITKLRYPRCFSCMLAMSSKLYLIGGAGKISSKDKTTTSLPTIDVWNEKIEEWEKISAMTIPRHGHAVAYLGTQILIIGGVTTVYMRALSNIECFCGNRGSWVRGIQPLPTALSGHAAITLPPAKLM